MINEKTIIVENIKTAYRECGSGDVLFLIHGMGSSLVWDDVLFPLSKYFHVIAIDLPGFGKSDKPNINYTIDFYVSFLNKFINILKIEKANIAGLSLGGWIATELTAKYPEKFENLILVASAGLKSIVSYFRFPFMNSIFNLLMKTIILSNKHSLRKYQEGSYFDKEKINPNVFSRFCEYITQPNAKNSYLSALKCVMKTDKGFKKYLEKISCRTLIIWGENDLTFGLEYANKFHNLIKNSVLKTIPNCGHTITIEKPDVFCNLVVEFLNKK